MIINNYRQYVNQTYLVCTLQDNSVNCSVKITLSPQKENVMVIVHRMTVITINALTLLKLLLMVRYVWILIYKMPNIYWKRIIVIKSTFNNKMYLLSPVSKTLIVMNRTVVLLIVWIMISQEVVSLLIIYSLLPKIHYAINYVLKMLLYFW